MRSYTAIIAQHYVECSPKDKALQDAEHKVQQAEKRLDDVLRKLKALDSADGIDEIEQEVAELRDEYRKAVKHLETIQDATEDELRVDLGTEASFRSRVEAKYNVWTKIKEFFTGQSKRLVGSLLLAAIAFSATAGQGATLSSKTKQQIASIEKVTGQDYEQIVKGQYDVEDVTSQFIKVMNDKLDDMNVKDKIYVTGSTDQGAKGAVLIHVRVLPLGQHDKAQTGHIDIEVTPQAVSFAAHVTTAKQANPLVQQVTKMLADTLNGELGLHVKVAGVLPTASEETDYYGDIDREKNRTLFGHQWK